ncbi:MULTISPECIES: MBL fold metallo-hydrolase [Micrococcaceae]|uniref:MBL fold metallo-hydrolase n=1 Tax=Micrococcaceae TaxID=1268 RepID=UPI000CFDDE75|nr:MBL fold metallo-hydrolase [Arthrobacter sp. MYb214]PRB73861.1 MBL fold metallo-hydrolase [Arthrobacter sp. MYb214]
MRIKLRGHSCLEASTIDGKVLLDPGGFSQLDDAFDGINAVLVTHEHADHADQPAIAAALEANSILELYAPAALAQAMRDQLPPAAQSQVVTVRAGADFIVGGIRVRTFGGTHATIHHSIAVVANVGYLLGDRAVGQLEVFHPGDSYQVPVGAQPDVLLLPVMAPWGKMAEAADFAVAVDAKCWMPIHDGLLNANGLGLFDRQLGAIAQRAGCSYVRLEPGIEHHLDELLGGTNE